LEAIIVVEVGGVGDFCKQVQKMSSAVADFVEGTLGTHVTMFRKIAYNCHPGQDTRVEVLTVVSIKFIVFWGAVL
jgi:hypothetical protein